jgi:hypothetical protein
MAFSLGAAFQGLPFALGLTSPPPLERPIVLNANAFPPCNTLVLGWRDRAGIKHADTIDYSLVGVPALRPRPCHPSGFADLRHHGVWLMKRRG